eukprot:TRINITY_DN2614_c0_g1_i2.p1 TRINITY_DN2614_c0_g1~~TRINITY_DN2614_c0_g1_i2.p1  ORF type:complete len:242 (+),score=24.21 TRINITY_DN2614_c0_g1_i2:27-728(+)
MLSSWETFTMDTRLKSELSGFGVSTSADLPVHGLTAYARLEENEQSAFVELLLAMKRSTNQEITGETPLLQLVAEVAVHLVPKMKDSASLTLQQFAANSPTGCSGGLNIKESRALSRLVNTVIKKVARSSPNQHQVPDTAAGHGGTARSYEHWQTSPTVAPAPIDWMQVATTPGPQNTNPKSTAQAAPVSGAFGPSTGCPPVPVARTSQILQPNPARNVSMRQTEFPADGNMR